MRSKKDGRPMRRRPTGRLRLGYAGSSPNSGKPGVIRRSHRPCRNFATTRLVFGLDHSSGVTRHEQPRHHPAQRPADIPGRPAPSRAAAHRRRRAASPLAAARSGYDSSGTTAASGADVSSGSQRRAPPQLARRPVPKATRSMVRPRTVIKLSPDPPPTTVRTLPATSTGSNATTWRTTRQTYCGRSADDGPVGCHRR